MKKKEIKKLTTDQAIKNIDKMKKDLFNFRFQKSNGQLASPSKIKQSKKTIARLKTLIERDFFHFQIDIEVSAIPSKTNISNIARI